MRVLEYLITRDGEKGTYSVVERPDSAAIIVTTPSGRTLFVRQYRFPTESYSWELPMGGVRDGEDFAAAAVRELHEETGLRAPLTEVGRFHPIPGLTPQTVCVFEAQVSDEVADTLSDAVEPVDDIVSRRFIPRAQTLEMLKDGRISDGLTLCSLALAHLPPRT